MSNRVLACILGGRVVALPSGDTPTDAGDNEIGGGGGGSTSFSSPTYNSQGQLTNFTANGLSYTLTYENGRVKTVNDGTTTYTMTYSNGRLNSISSS